MAATFWEKGSKETQWQKQNSSQIAVAFLGEGSKETHVRWKMLKEWQKQENSQMSATFREEGSKETYARWKWLEE